MVDRTFLPSVLTNYYIVKTYIKNKFLATKALGRAEISSLEIARLRYLKLWSFPLQSPLYHHKAFLKDG